MTAFTATLSSFGWVDLQADILREPLAGPFLSGFCYSNAPLAGHQLHQQMRIILCAEAEPDIAHLKAQAFFLARALNNPQGLSAGLRDAGWGYTKEIPIPKSPTGPGNTYILLRWLTRAIWTPAMCVHVQGRCQELLKALEAL